MAIFVVAIPAAVAALALLLARRLRRGEETPLWPGVAAGFAAGYLGIGGVPKSMPVEKWHWLLPIAVLGAVVGALRNRESLPVWLRRNLSPALMVTVVLCTLLRPTTVQLLAYGVAAFFVEVTIDGDPKRTTARSFLSVVLVVATASAIALVVSGTMLIGQMAGALAAVAGACLVLAGPLRVELRSAVPLVAALFVALWMNGILFAELPIASAALLASAPLACWIADIALSNRLRPPPMTIARVAVAIVVAGAGVAVAVLEAPPLDY